MLSDFGIALQNSPSPTFISAVYDTWIVKNIDLYPTNVVTVYDNSGKTIFNKKGYANDWYGTYQGTKLNEGTYGYTIALGNGAVLSGFITIVRDR